MHRLDSYIVSLNLTSSRTKAQELINNAQITVNGITAKKSSQLVSSEDDIQLIGENLKYVSRGGLKLERALTNFNIDVTGLVCADIGSSTGGFTDCLLQNGAARVYAVDVGSGQLDSRIMQDNRVVSLENTNIRHIDSDVIPQPIDFTTTDVSFISITLISKVIFDLLSPDGRGVFLIKPQFEAGKANVGKNGVVKEPKIHKRVVKSTIINLIQVGFYPYNLDYSPIKGPNGNIEYLIYVGKQAGENCVSIEETIMLAHKNLRSF